MENTFVLDVNSPAMESAVKSLDMMLKRCLYQELYQKVVFMPFLLN